MDVIVPPQATALAGLLPSLHSCRFESAKVWQGWYG